MEATSDMANSPTSASSASIGHASSLPSPMQRTLGALAAAGGETEDLRRVADYIFTRNE